MQDVLTQVGALHQYGVMSQTTTAAPLSSAQACQELGGIDRSTLSRWVEKGIIVPAYKLPGRNGAFVFDRAEVERVKAERGAAA